MAPAIIDWSPAVREDSRIIITLVGKSSSGKTLSALYLARGLVGPAGKIGLLDTEHKRALVYANDAAPWIHGPLSPPFTPERYVASIESAIAAAFDCLIIDSGSHEWEGLGGVLDLADATGQEGLLKWAGPKAKHKRFMQAVINCPIHLIFCLRAKEKLVQTKDPQTGKKVIVSKGFVSIQDKDFIYETTIELFMPSPEDRNLIGIPVPKKLPKDLEPAFPANARISIKTGEAIREWLGRGKAVDPAQTQRISAARLEADKGSAALKSHWEALSRDERKALAIELDNLKSIATEADRAEAERIATAAALAAEAKADPANMDDPFAVPPKRADDAEPMELYAADGELVAAFGQHGPYAQRAFKLFLAAQSLADVEALMRVNAIGFEALPKDLRELIASAESDATARIKRASRSAKPADRLV